MEIKNIDKVDLEKNIIKVVVIDKSGDYAWYDTTPLEPEPLEDILDTLNFDLDDIISMTVEYQDGSVVAYI